MAKPTGQVYYGTNGRTTQAQSQFLFANHRSRFDGASYFLPYNFPLETNEAILFPYNFKTGKFNIDHYNPSMTNQRVSKQEIADFLAPAEEHMLEWNKKQNFTTCCFIFWLILGSFIFPLLFCVLTYMCKKNSEIRPLFMRAQKNVQKYFNDQNELYKQRNLTWCVPQTFPLYIELWKTHIIPGQQNLSAMSFQPNVNSMRVAPDSGLRLIQQPQVQPQFQPQFQPQVQSQFQPQVQPQVELQYGYPGYETPQNPNQQIIYGGNQYGANTYGHVNYNV